MNSFEIEDGPRTLTFAVAPLDVEAQLQLLALIGPVVTVFVNAARGGSEPPAHVVATLQGLPAILKMFEGKTTVHGYSVDPSIAVQDAKPMPLKAIRENVFKGKMGLLVSFIVLAVKGELSDFLPGNGRTLENLATALGLHFPSVSTGGSGASQATPD